jgi:hypothetical protein
MLFQEKSLGDRQGYFIIFANIFNDSRDFSLNQGTVR